jgi:ubiquinone/menaquinone biosynthesis C-methylase UbiE
VASRAFPPWFGWFLESRLRLLVLPPHTLVERLPLATDFTVVEVGSGTGVYARAVRSRVHRFIGVELQWSLIRQARTRDAFLPLAQGTAMSLPLRPASVDLIYMVTVLGEITDREQALREIFNALRPGGFLTVAEQLPDPDYVPLKRLRALCAAAGFAFIKTDGPWWSYVATFTRPRRDSASPR